MHNAMNGGRRSLSQWEAGLKRTFDLFSSVVLLVLFGWVMLGLAVAVRITGPHVIYGHSRIGRNGKEFRCLKFRTMVIDSDRVLAELLASDPEARAEWDRDFKLKNDPRVTRIGRFLRRTSLDELPQIWNIVRGDMSVVGPRPVVRKELDLYYAGALDHYLSVRPGLTGLWQVSGRNDLDYASRVALDRAYVENWSVLTDLQIVLRTASVIFRGKGAY